MWIYSYIEIIKPVKIQKKKKSAWNVSFVSLDELAKQRSRNRQCIVRSMASANTCIACSMCPIQKHKQNMSRHSFVRVKCEMPGRKCSRHTEFWHSWCHANWRSCKHCRISAYAHIDKVRQSSETEKKKLTRKSHIEMIVPNYICTQFNVWVFQRGKYPYILLYTHTSYPSDTSQIESSLRRSRATTTKRNERKKKKWTTRFDAVEMQLCTISKFWLFR